MSDAQKHRRFARLVLSRVRAPVPVVRDAASAALTSSGGGGRKKAEHPLRVLDLAVGEASDILAIDFDGPNPQRARLELCARHDPYGRVELDVLALATVDAAPASQVRAGCTEQRKSPADRDGGQTHAHRRSGLRGDVERRVAVLDVLLGRPPRPARWRSLVDDGRETAL